MKLRIIEAVLLLGVVVLVGGCDSDCLDFDLQLSQMLGLSHYVICSKNPISEQYQPMEISVNIPGVTSGETYAPASAFDCGTSVNGEAPLPHPRSAAAVPAAAASGSQNQSMAKRNVSLQATATPAGSALPYRSFGFNNGYVPSGVINPNIPVPGDPAQSDLSPSCAPSSPDVLFVNHLHNTATRIGTCPFSTKATIPLVSRPLQVAVTPDGTQALVTSFDNAVNFINLATNTVSYTLKTDPSINPAGIAITPDGKRAYVTSFNNLNSSILVIDIASHAVITSMHTGAWPQAVFITPDGSQAWVSYPFQNEVDVFDTLTNTLTAGRFVSSPVGMAFDPTGSRVYIASGPASLVAFDTATLKQIATYKVGNGPVDVNVLPGGRFVVVNNFGSANLSLIDTAKGAVTTMTLGDGATSSLGLVPVR